MGVPTTGPAPAIVGNARPARILRQDGGCKACNLCEKSAHAHAGIATVETVKEGESKRRKAYRSGRAHRSRPHSRENTQ